MAPRPGHRSPAPGPTCPWTRRSAAVRLRANEAYWAGPPPIESHHRHHRRRWPQQRRHLRGRGGRLDAHRLVGRLLDPLRPQAWPAAAARRGDGRGVPRLRHRRTAVRRCPAYAAPWPWPSIGAAWRNSMATATHPPTSLLPPGIAGARRGRLPAALRPRGCARRAGRSRLPRGRGLPGRLAGDVRGRTSRGHRRRPGGVSWASRSTSSCGRSKSTAALLERDTPDDVDLWPGAPTTRMPTTSWACSCAADSSANVGGWSDAGYDALIDAAAATGDAAQQEQLYAEAQAIVRDEVPVIPLDYGSSWWLSRDGLRGGQISGVGARALRRPGLGRLMRRPRAADPPGTAGSAHARAHGSHAAWAPRTTSRSGRRARAGPSARPSTSRTTFESSRPPDACGAADPAARRGPGPRQHRCRRTARGGRLAGVGVSRRPHRAQHHAGSTASASSPRTAS